MTRHADHAAKIIAAAASAANPAGAAARVIICRTAGMAKPTTTKAHPASRYRS